MLRIADTNEFHPLTNASAYASVSPVIILRAHNGDRPDNCYRTNVQAAYGQSGIVSVGHYGYLPATVDAHTAGVEFGQTVKLYGGLRRHDFIICDDEEGAGDQAPRMEAWLAGAHSVLGEATAQEWGYSGASFWSAHLGSAVVGHRWIAAYGQASAPPMGEALWQFTANGSMPGVAGQCDVSTFGGSVADFLALLGGASAPAQPAPSEQSSSLKRGNMLAFDPETGGTWALRPDGSVYAEAPAEYLGGLNTHPEWNAGAGKTGGPAVGIAAFGPNGSGGYEILCDNGTEPAPARYRFPRDGSLAK